jgi:RimJ/RimL family protein N-acetyltransferase
MMVIYNRLKRAFQKRIFSQPRVLFFSLDNAVKSEAYSGLEVCFPDMDSFLARVVDWPRQAAQSALYRDRYKAGDQAIISSVNNEIVHLAWFGKREEIRPDYELGEDCVFPLSASSAVIYDCWTPESARGLGYYPKTLQKLSSILLQQYDHLWIYCLIENHASRRGIEKAGFTLAAELKGLRVLGRFWKCCRC